MGKRTSFVGFLTIAIVISLLVFACGKKQDADKPTVPADSNTSTESNSPALQEPPVAEMITTQTDADSNEPELPKSPIANQTPTGLITAIAYSDRPAVLIGDELLSEGDTIQGARVVKINEGTVEFEKNGKRWTQQAGETPAAYWSDPNS